MAKTVTSKTRTKRFKENLRSLIASAGLTQREFADKLDLPYNWIRKSCNDGIARSHPKNEKSLRAICDLFNLSQIDSLWGKRIASTEWKTEDLAEQHREFVDDLNWLLKEFPDNHNVAEVKRVICEVVEYIRRPTSPNQDAGNEEQPNPKLGAAMPRAERSKTNLRHLIEVAGMTQKAFALRIDISYIWLRKSCTIGVARLHPRNEKYIRAICGFFDLRNNESLWDGRLIVKRLKSIDEVAEEQRTLVSDLIWLLKEHGDAQDAKVRSHVVEVKRVITTVVKHLFVSKEKPTASPEGQRPQRTDAELFEELDKLICSSSAPISSPRTPVASTSEREARFVGKDLKRRSYLMDIDDLDDQLDGTSDDDDVDPLQEDEDYEFEDFQSNLAMDPTPELIEANKRLCKIVLTVIDCLPKSLRASFSDDDLRSTISRMIFRQVPLDEVFERLKTQRLVDEFMAEISESVRAAFEEDKLLRIVTSMFAKGVSPEILRKNLEKIAAEMGIVAEPEIIRRTKRIRRRQIPLHQRKQMPKSVADSETA